MGADTAIEWCDHTFNPWVGCTKVSPGCDHCYAESWAKRAGKAAGVTWGQTRRRTGAENWDKPLKWNAQAEREGRRYRVFCASLADVFDNEVLAGWRVDLFNLIVATPHLEWLLLTKRIGNVMPMLRDMGGLGLPPNVWLGATVVNQAEADRDIPKLLSVPARVRFLSIEPMLGPIDLTSIDRRGSAGAMRPLDGRFNRVHWVICGGESGPGARPMHPEWAASLRNQCEAAGVPFLFKQWGEWMPESAMTLQQRMRDCGQYESFLTKLDGRTHWIDADDHEPFDASDVRMVKIGKKAAGRLLDGREHNGFPEVA